MTSSPTITTCEGMCPDRAPTVVAIGGGHGLAASLRAVRRYAGEITAVVSVADDGGSSGRLRRVMPELPAPGDVRRCLSALADPDSALGRTLEHRFGAEEGRLEGHALGNLILAGLTAELGSFAGAVDELGRLVGSAGRVVPATVGPVALEAELQQTRRRTDDPEHPEGPDRVVGQVAVQNAGGVVRVGLTGDQPARLASPEAVAAILAADQVVLGPGSLFTSVLAAAVVPGIRDALTRTDAQRVYVANLAPQMPETAGFTVADHVDAVVAHHIPIDVVVCPVDAGPRPREDGFRVVEHPVAAPDGRVHDPARLAEALAALSVRR